MICKKYGFLIVLIAGYLFLAGLLPAMAGGWLGVTLEPPRGVQVAEIFKGSPADQNDIHRGDIIHRMDGVAILSMAHFRETLARIQAGKEVLVEIWRMGKPMKIKVTLENDEAHQTHTQVSTGLWRPPAYVPLLPSSPSPLFGETLRPQEGQGYLSPYGRPGAWESYRPPQERHYRPALSSAWLGVAPGVAAEGVAVIGVAPDSPAEQAELKVGDTITAINRQAMDSPEGLVQALRGMRPGDLVEISFQRDGRTRMLQVQLQKSPVAP